MAAFDQGRYQEAEDLFWQLYQLEPGGAVLGLSEVYMAEKRQDEAIRLLAAELEKDPRSTELRMGLGNLFVRTEQYDKGIAEFQRVLDTRGNLTTETIANLYFRIAEAFRRKGDPNAAIRMFQRVSAICRSESQRPDGTVVDRNHNAGHEPSRSGRTLL